MIPEFHRDASFRDLLEPAMDIAERGDAREARLFVDSYADFLTSRGMGAKEAVEVVMNNIGYYAGYYGPATRKAVADVFGAVHPVLGHQDRFGRTAPGPTVEEAFAAGMKHGEKLRRREWSQE